MTSAIASGETACASRWGDEYGRVLGASMICGATARPFPFCTDQDVSRFTARKVNGPHRIRVIYR